MGENCAKKAKNCYVKFENVSISLAVPKFDRLSSWAIKVNGRRETLAKVKALKSLGEQ